MAAGKTVRLILSKAGQENIAWVKLTVNTGEERRKHLMKFEVRVQLEGGVAALTRSAVLCRLNSKRKVRGHLVEAWWSLAAFVCGLLLASLYSITTLFLQNQSLWLCVYSTLAVAFMAAFGMGLSASVRADIMIMLPSLCSAQGRRFLLFLSMSLLLAAPLSNTVENTKRAATSLMCGAELAANQTQELLQRAATPLFSALDRIKEISSKAVSVAGRVHNLIHALTDSVRHVGENLLSYRLYLILSRTLRNVLHFLVDIGDMCNAKLSSPYRKCQAVFAEARADCSDLLGEFNFLCDIINSFLPLCQLTRVSELFCVIPSYISSHVKTRLAAPTIAAFERMKREFDFNVTASVTFDLDANSSRSLQQVTQDIMEEVSSELQVFQKLSELLAYGGLILLACSFLRHMVMSGLLVALDFMVFWMLDQVHQQVKGDLVVRGEGQLITNITAFSVRAVITMATICSGSSSHGVGAGLLLGLALLVSLSAGFMQRCRRLVCSSYHPEREQDRILFLHQLILDHRKSVEKALQRSAAMNQGGGGGGSCLQTLLLRHLLIPLSDYLEDLTYVTCLVFRQSAVWPVAKTWGQRKTTSPVMSHNVQAAEAH
ncbi:hypothetical protein PAMA_015743 [Pampus argenteus]